MSMPKSSLVTVSERRFNRLLRAGEIKLMVIETTYVHSSGIQRAFTIAPIGRINNKIKNYNPEIYCNWLFADNVNFLVKSAKNSEDIDHVIDLCKLFSENTEILELGKKLIKLKLLYKCRVKEFLNSIRENIAYRRQQVEVNEIKEKTL